MGQNEIKSLYEKRVKTAKHHPDSASSCSIRQALKIVRKFKTRDHTPLR